MKKNIWVIPILAALVVFAGPGAFAGMMQGEEMRCGMMQDDTSKCPMVNGDTTQCPMAQGDTKQCPMLNDVECNGDATNMECPHIQQTDLNTLTKQQSDTNKMKMDSASMAECEHIACICDHTSGSCVNDTGIVCMCCDKCANSGICTEDCCVMSMLKAVIDVTPGNLNLLGKGKFITVYIELDENPDGFTVNDIDKSTIYLKQVNMMMCPEGEKIYPVGPILYGDYDEDGTDDLKVKFNRQTIINFLFADGLSSKEVSMCVAGELFDGTKVSGKDTIKITGDKLLKMWIRGGMKY
jgi:hypothetical protein